MFSIFITKCTLNKDDDIAAQLPIRIHTMAAQRSEQKRKAYINLIHCHLTGICEPPICHLPCSV